MRIDYSIHPHSKYCAFIDVPFRQSINHWVLGIKGKQYGLSVAQRVKHIVMGILKMIPILGHATALIDTLRQKKNFTHLKLKVTDPFLRGRDHGLLLKRQIKKVYEPILAKARNPIALEKMLDFEQQLPQDLKDEMKGLAAGSGYKYDDVLLIHTFLDAQPGHFGCTSMVCKQEVNETEKRIAAANHSIAPSILIKNNQKDAESKKRRDAFLAKPIPKNGSTEKVLKTAGVKKTIQAMVFDTRKGEIKLASRGTYAAHGRFRRLSPDSLFQTHNFKPTESQLGSMQLFRNLDWPWYFLGQKTVIITRPHLNGNSTVSVSWPGYIGTLSGMNNQGLALAVNERDQEINPLGIPNPLLFTHILDTCKTLSEASRVIEGKQHGSSANLVIADKTSAKSYELGGHSLVSCVEKIN